MAWSQLTPEVKAKVTALLQQHPDYASTLTRESKDAGEERDAKAFAIAATWPDLIRSASFGPSAKYGHAEWHYADTPYVMGNFPPPPGVVFKWTPGTNPANAIQAIAKNLADLNDPKATAVDRAVALCWMEHLVGDIHQPLHSVSMYSETYPTGDRGGNSQYVKLDGRTMNLHSLWDGMLGGYMDIGAVKQIADKLVAAHPRKEFEKELTESDPQTWAGESYEKATKTVYLEGKLATGNNAQSAVDLPARYMEAAKPVAERGAVLGGYRLAAVIMGVFAEKQ